MKENGRETVSLQLILSIAQYLGNQQNSLRSISEKE
nr:MAG TPA: hypothetical protein [Caudoviricetes sp.]